jgi:hypothetical protein
MNPWRTIQSAAVLEHEEDPEVGEADPVHLDRSADNSIAAAVRELASSSIAGGSHLAEGWWPNLSRYSSSKSTEISAANQSMLATRKTWAIVLSSVIMYVNKQPVFFPFSLCPH